MTKEERNKRLNKILEIYKSEEISLQTLSSEYDISVPTISKFLKINGIDIKRINSKSNLSQAIEDLKYKTVEEVSKEYGIDKQILLLSNSNISKSEYKKKIIQMKNFWKCMINYSLIYTNPLEYTLH